MLRCIRFIAVLFLASEFSGCATSSVLSSYSTQSGSVVSKTESGQIDAALDELAAKCKGKDMSLYLLEHGRVAQIGGMLDESKASFAQAVDLVREAEDAARISVSESGAVASSMLTNENAIPFEVRGYQKVFLYHCQAMNYLFEGDLEGSGVEVRRANNEQVIQYERHLAEIDKARKEAEQEASGGLAAIGAMDQHYASMDQVASRVMDSFQNAYTFYVSGLVYEMRGEKNDAYIDYRRALEIFPGNPYVRNDAARLARELGMNDDLETLGLQGLNAQHGQGTGDLVVLFEDGVVPPLQEIQVPLPTPWGVVSTAFPIYKAPPGSGFRAEVSASGDLLGHTEPICDVYALAAKSLKERAPLLAMREVLRVASRTGIQKAIAENQNSVVSMISSAYNLAVSNADLRAWNTLPGEVQILRAALPPGTHALSLTTGYGASHTQDVEIAEGRITLIRLCRVGNSVYVQALGPR
jgi:hypothetical protein